MKSFSHCFEAFKIAIVGSEGNLGSSIMYLWNFVFRNSAHFEPPWPSYMAKKMLLGHFFPADFSE